MEDTVPRALGRHRYHPRTRRSKCLPLGEHILTQSVTLVTLIHVHRFDIHQPTPKHLGESDRTIPWTLADSPVQVDSNYKSSSNREQPVPVATGNETVELLTLLQSCS